MTAALAGTYLASQAELLRELRAASLDDIDTLLDKLSRSTSRERQLVAQVASARRQAMTNTARIQELDSELEASRTALSAAVKRAAWDLRKRDEAAAAAAAAAASKARESDEELRAEIARQAAVIQKQEVELRSAQALIRKLRHQIADDALLQRQAAFIGDMVKREPASAPQASSSIVPRRAASAAPNPGPTARESGSPHDTDADQNALAPLQHDFIARVLNMR